MMYEQGEIERSDFWDGKPDFVERAIILEGGGFMPADVYTNYHYTCVFKAQGEWYIHSQGLWQCGSGYNGGSSTEKLQSVTDENIAQYVADYVAKHPETANPHPAME